MTVKDYFDATDDSSVPCARRDSPPALFVALGLAIGKELLTAGDPQVFPDRQDLRKLPANLVAELDVKIF